MIPDDKIAELRERTDIVALVGEYVSLKRVGASFRGLCPFHSEKTPSFYVHPGRAFYHCFGCQASGDVLSFIMRLEGRTFPEATRLLAERAGVELPVLDVQEEAQHKRARVREEQLLAALEAAAGFYMRMLEEHPLGEMARSELAARGIGKATADSFRLGYAPDGWDALASHFRDRGISDEHAEEVGLLVPRRSGTGHYDRFRHRLVFPISDAQGRIVAFSGRLLDPPPSQSLPEQGEGGAKYVNSPESSVYHKGDVLFGLHEGRVALRRGGEAIVCEGNFDLVALHQAGFQHAVAPLGTALTAQHVRLLRRYVERVVLLFDADAAGRKAVRAAQPLLFAEGLSVRVASLPAGQDPDTFLRERGASALTALTSAAPGVVEHLIDEAAADAGADVAQRAQAIERLGPVLASVGNPVEVRLYIERVAQKFAVSDLVAVRQQLRRGLNASRQRQPGRSRTQEGPEGDRARLPKKPAIQPDLPPMQRELVGALLDQPPLIGSEVAKNLEELLTSSDLRAIFHAAASMVALRGSVDASALLRELSACAAYGWLEGRLAIQKYDEAEARQALADGIPRLARANIERELPKLQAQILTARRQGDDETAEKLTRERDGLYVSSNRLMHSTKMIHGTKR